MRSAHLAIIEILKPVNKIVNATNKSGKKNDESKNKERKKENTEQSENCKKRDRCIDCISKAAFVVKKKSLVIKLKYAPI